MANTSESLRSGGGGRGVPLTPRMHVTANKVFPMRGSFIDEVPSDRTRCMIANELHAGF